jgi:outer membrane receptor protein involved in Fe transport
VGLDLATFPLDANTVELLRLQGNPRIKPEEVRDYELGYRTQVSAGVSVDVATFLSAYRRLTTTEPGTPVVVPSLPPILVKVPMVYDNRGYSLNYGGEVAVNWNATPHWRISPAYSLLRVNAHLDPILFT